ncbi:MAG: DUF4129 domain-containing protein [Candidatus Hydrogenedentes bacterium]|nr:DUF4129 domain-containing protein [Candidatus Hydrogenedentota bacterium]
MIQPVAYAGLVLLICIAGIMGWRVWKTRARVRSEFALPDSASPPDIEDEGVLASELPEDGWLALARELAGRGEYRLALRAVFLASLAQLAQKELVRVAKFKSNRDYQRELSRRAHAAPELVNVFSALIDQFEQVWYGTREATSAHVKLFFAEQERIRLHAP